MLVALEVTTLTLVAIAMAQALAHALELPGKLRLAKDDYLVVQQIYYPGFTIGGAAEPLALLAALALVLLTPPGVSLWLAAGAFVALAAMHATYWAVTHPVNRFWLKDVELKGFSGGFFGFDPLARGNSTDDWTRLRNQWEFSHVVRAAFGLVSFVLLAIAVAV
jgi:hypothetical protein